MRPEVTERIKQMALDFTAQLSVVETPGEIEMAQLIYDTIADIDYYKKHPDLVYQLDCNDQYGRKIVVAEMNGEKKPSDKTIVMIGHFDTVGISDYGNLKEYAGNPEVLAEEFKKWKLPEEAREDLESGKYIFGRGIFDMKSGDAAVIGVMEEISRDIENFEGNLIYCAVCDEESNSTGMLTFVPHLVKLREEKGYDYQAMIDPDYMAPAFPGDPEKYVFIGTVGKIMPTFYVVGKETHVGESFDGLDPNRITSELVARINLNPEFCDVVDGEVTLPPVTLKQRDLKTEYSVQTATKSLLLVNYATHCSEPDDVLKEMKRVAKEEFQYVVSEMNKRYKTFCKMAGREVKDVPWKPRALTYEELYAAVREEMGEELDRKMAALLEELKANDKMDLRDKTFHMVDYLHELWSDKDPVIIVYFTPPYYPHVAVKDENKKDKALLKAVKKAIKTVKADPDFDYPLRQKRFLPCISDLSYATAPTSQEAIDMYMNNTPGYGEDGIYNLPLKEMQSIDVPVTDIGTVGKDAHKFTERIDPRFTFQYTPELIYQTIMNLMESWS